MKIFYFPKNWCRKVGVTEIVISLNWDSMGGAIAVRVAAKRAMPTLAGLVVVDVVEVTAYHFWSHLFHIYI